VSDCRSHDPYYRKPTLSRGKSREKDKQLHSPVLTNSSLTVLRQFGTSYELLQLIVSSTPSGTSVPEEEFKIA